MAVSDRLDGKIAVVTGGSTGIGLETARGLARLGARVILIARNEERGLRAADSIRSSTANSSVEFLQADLSSIAELRRVAALLLDSCPAVDILINNAGGLVSQRNQSADGIEMTWALNFTSTFLLTHLLLDALRRSGQARVINVASAVMAGELTRKDLDPAAPYKMYRAYGESKLAVVAFSKELARRLEGTGITVNALHPGVVSTTVFWNSIPKPLRWLRPVIARFVISPEQGSETPLFLATSPSVAGVSGRFFENCQEKPAKPAADDAAVQAEVWRLGESQTGTA